MKTETAIAATLIGFLIVGASSVIMLTKQEKERVKTKEVKATQDTYYTARMPDGNFETMIQRTIGGIQVTCYIVRSAEKKQTIVANCNQREVSVGRLTGDIHGSNQRLDLQATFKE